MRCDIEGLNRASFVIGDFTLFFSYHTLVAVRYRGETYKTEVKYSRTTGKHLRQISGFPDQEKFEELRDAIEEFFDVISEANMEDMKKIAQGEAIRDRLSQLEF